MNITRININKYEDDYKIENHMDKNLLANVDIIIDYSFIIKNIKLMNGYKGYYLKFPVNYKGKAIAFPVKDESRKYILDKIIEAYLGESIYE